MREGTGGIKDEDGEWRIEDGSTGRDAGFVCFGTSSAFDGEKERQRIKTVAVEATRIRRPKNRGRGADESFGVHPLGCALSVG